MTQRIAILDNADKVINIVVYPDDFIPDATHVVAHTGVRVGDTFRGGIFVSGPPLPEPLDDPIVRAIRVIANIMGGDAPARVEAHLSRI